MKIRALLAGLLCAMGLVFLTGCGDSPKAAFKEIKEGFSKGDVAKVKSRMAKKSLESVPAEMLEAMIKEPKIQEMWKKAEIVSCTENGDKATVKVKVDGKEETSTFVKEDGKWKMEK